jgi:hypothetical protein
MTELRIQEYAVRERTPVMLWQNASSLTFPADDRGEVCRKWSKSVLAHDASGVEPL